MGHFSEGKFFGLHYLQISPLWGGRDLWLFCILTTLKQPRNHSLGKKKDGYESALKQAKLHALCGKAKAIQMVTLHPPHLALYVEQNIWGSFKHDI